MTRDELCRAMDANRSKHDDLAFDIDSLEMELDALRDQQIQLDAALDVLQEQFTGKAIKDSDPGELYAV